MGLTIPGVAGAVVRAGRDGVPRPTITSRTVAITPIIPRSSLAPMSPNALALVELLIRERRALSRFIARYLDPASTEDTLQNLYLKASSVPGDPPILEPRGYLYRMAYHHALNRSQADARERRAMAEYACEVGDAVGGEQQALDQAQLREITRTILALPPQVRECFVLNRYLGLSEREIAARLGISKSLVGKHVLRAAMLIQQHQQGARR